MLPSIERLSEAYRFVARRRQPDALCDDVALAEALVEARRNAAGIVEDEPAALFFALSRRPRALGPLWRRFSEMTALNHARAVGIGLVFTADQLRAMRLDIVSQDADYARIRDAFRRHAER